jgi:hypothetical protein
MVEGGIVTYVMEVDGGEGTADEEFIEATEAR